LNLNGLARTHFKRTGVTSSEIFEVMNRTIKTVLITIVVIIVVLVISWLIIDWAVCEVDSDGCMMDDYKF